MYIINQRFLRDLFIEKKVSINTEIYTELYDYVWKCEELFIEFLSHNDASIKLNYAKKIYSFLQANNDIFLPISMVDNIIEFQNSNLVDNIDGYIPQDHIIHCINLYITGIYIFFNNELFNKKLISGINSTKNPLKRYKDFIDKWLLFSFYHDVGYYLEGSINSKGHYNDKCKDTIKYYKSEFINELVYLCTTRIITRLITIATITPKKQELFSNKDINNFNFFCDQEDSSALLKEYEGAVLIDDLHNFEDYCVLQHIFKYTKSITISYDNDHKPICIMLREAGRIKHFFINRSCKNSFNSDSVELEECLDIIKDLPCNHYVLDINKVFCQYGETLFEELAVDFFEKLPKKLKEEFIFMSSSKELSSYFNHINEWIISKLKTEYLTNNVEYIHEELLSSCYKNVFISAFDKTIQNMFQKYKNDKFSSEKISKYIVDIFTNLDTKKLENDIHTEANILYENSHGAFIDILDFAIIAYHELYEFLYTSKNNKELIKSLEFIKFSFPNKVTIEPFSHNKKNSDSIESKFYDKLSALSNELKINFSELQKYNTSYTVCDHGVMSAALLYQALTVFFYINEGSKKHMKFNLLWNTPENKELHNNGTCIDKYADVIFAILLHNIYTKNSAEYGIEYKHDIDINPFSYFCAYCDTIQKWNRPKQVDLSKTYLPENNYLNDLFDLEIKHNKIYLRCFYKDLSQMNHILINSEDFLPGITQFTKVLGIED